MGADQTIRWRAAAASALDWWHEAGVDILVGEEPCDWRAPPAVTPPPAAAPARVIERAAALPPDRAAFAAWRTGPEAPEAGWPGDPLAPTGGPAADLAVLLDCPEREDIAERRLLSGDQGRLFDRMLAAIGQRRESIYLTSLMLKRPPGGRVTDPVAARLAEVARHGLALSGAKRVLALGNAASRALTEMDVTAARGRLHPVNHGDRTMAAVVCFHPRLLLERPACKAEAWSDLRLLIGGSS